MLAVRVRWRRVTLALLLAWLVSWLLLSGLLLLLHVDFLSDSCTDTASKEILHRLVRFTAAHHADQSQLILSSFFFSLLILLPCLAGCPQTFQDVHHRYKVMTFAPKSLLDFF